MSSKVICLMVLQQHEVQIGTKVLKYKNHCTQNNKLSIWGALLRNLMWRLKDKHSNGYTYCGKWAISENSSVDSKTTSVKWQAGVQQHRNLIKHTLPKIAFPCKIAKHLLCTTKMTTKDQFIYRIKKWLLLFIKTMCGFVCWFGSVQQHIILMEGWVLDIIDMNVWINHQRNNICMHIIFLACTTWYYISKSSCPDSIRNRVCFSILSLK